MPDSGSNENIFPSAVAIVRDYTKPKTKWVEESETNLVAGVGIEPTTFGL